MFSPCLLVSRSPCLPLVSPLVPHKAVFFLLHFPYPRPLGLGRWTLSTTVSCGARTFLSRASPRLTRTRAGQRPSGRLAGHFHPISFLSLTSALAPFY